MDGLFFVASKTLGMAARAESWMILGLVVTLLAIWRNRRGLALGAGGLTLALMGGLTIWPLGDLALAGLEARYPANPGLGQVDAIIVLGGAEQPPAHRRWGELALNEAGERMIAGVLLARRFPQARLIFTGGEAALGFRGDTRGPSAMTRALWVDLGIDPARIVLESASRNTAENARLTFDLVQPEAGERFVLVTSAFHMPRSMATFARAGWQNLTAWPVDFRSGPIGSGPLPGGAGWRLDEHLGRLNVALKEYLGLLAYRLTGR